MGRINTHGATLGERLERLGFTLSRETSVSDDPREMEAVFREVWRRSDVVLTTGGLGPTFDDRTRDVWSRVTGRPLRTDRGLVAEIVDRFRRRGIPMPPANRRQAQVLQGARVMSNAHGTAPGLLLDTGRKVLALFPGPAGELHPLFDGEFAQFLKHRFAVPFRETRVVRLFGRPESLVDDALRPLLRKFRSGRGVSVVWGILAQGSVVDVKITATGAAAKAAMLLNLAEGRLRRLFGGAIFGTGVQTLEEVVGDLLRRRGESVAVAESCTGGTLAQKLTRRAGSSDFFREGWVTYTNASKTARLGVRRATLRRDGAVSMACAREMASGARRRSGADWAMAVTGIAGPGGATAEKPVGRVAIAWAGPRGVTAEEMDFRGTRESVREQSALRALEGLRERLSTFS
jgi:nicotinamide-nucleotide amidase